MKAETQSMQSKFSMVSNQRKRALTVPKRSTGQPSSGYLASPASKEKTKQEKQGQTDLKQKPSPKTGSLNSGQKKKSGGVDTFGQAIIKYLLKSEEVNRAVLKQKYALENKRISEKLQQVRRRDTSNKGLDDCEEEVLNIHDYPIMDFSSQSQPWKTLYLGLISPNVNKYQDFMSNTLAQCKKQKQGDKKDVKIPETELLAGDSSRSSNPLSARSYDAKSQISKLQSRQSSQNSFKSSEQRAKIVSRENTVDPDIYFRQQVRKLSNKNLIQLNKAHSLVTPNDNQRFFCQPSDLSQKSSSNLKSTSSKMSRLLKSAKKSNSIMAILKKPSGLMEQLKKKNVVFQRNNLGLDFTKTTKITDWKKDCLINEILEGKMSQKAQQFHEQIMSQGRYSLQSLINQKNYVNQEIYKLFLKKKAKSFPYRASNPHLRLDLEKGAYIDFEQFETITKAWEQIQYQQDSHQGPSNKKRRTKSMVDLGNLRSMQKLIKNLDDIFNSTKKKGKNGMATISKTDLNQVVRRKSCFCSGCGGHGEAIERLLMRETLKEPIAPFVKSKEEIAYDKRLLKRIKAIEDLQKMQLDVLNGNINWDGSPSQDQEGLNPQAQTLQRQTQIINEGGQLPKDQSSVQNMDVGLFHNSIERLQKNSLMMRNGSSVIQSIQQQLLLQKQKLAQLTNQGVAETPNEKGSNESQSVKAQAQKDLQEISEEQELQLPLYRSVRVQGKGSSQMATLIRNPLSVTNYSPISQAKRTITTQNSEQFMNSPTLVPQFSQKHKSQADFFQPFVKNQIIEKFQHNEESPAYMADPRLDESSNSGNESIKSNSSCSSLHTSIKSEEMDPYYIKKQHELKLKKERRAALSKLTKQQVIKGAYKVDPRQTERLSKLINSQQGRSTEDFRIRNSNIQQLQTIKEGIKSRLCPPEKKRMSVQEKQRPKNSQEQQIRAFSPMSITQKTPTSSQKSFGFRKWSEQNYVKSSHAGINSSNQPVKPFTPGMVYLDKRQNIKTPQMANNFRVTSNSRSRNQLTQHLTEPFSNTVSKINSSSGMTATSSNNRSLLISQVMPRTATSENQIGILKDVLKSQKEQLDDYFKITHQINIHNPEQRGKAFPDKLKVKRNSKQLKKNLRETLLLYNSQSTKTTS